MSRRGRYRLQDLGKAGELRNNTPRDPRIVREGLAALKDLTHILRTRARTKSRKGVRP